MDDGFEPKTDLPPTVVQTSLVSEAGKMDPRHGERLQLPIVAMTQSKAPAIKDFKPFLGYGPDEFESAKKFYQEIGFKAYWENETVCAFDTGIGQRFLVTLHHGLDRSSAGMLQLWVESVDEWQAFLETLKLPDRYPNVKVAEPTITEWGWRILYVWDPGGYLLHIGEPHNDETERLQH